jgi:hypothetical protein
VFSVPKLAPLRELLRRPQVSVRSIDTGVPNRRVHSLAATREGAEAVKVTVHSAGTVPTSYGADQFRLGLWRVDSLASPPDIALASLQSGVPFFLFGPPIEAAAAAKKVRGALPTATLLPVDLFRRDPARPHPTHGHSVPRDAGYLAFCPGAAVSHALVPYFSVDVGDLPPHEPALHPAIAAHLWEAVAAAPIRDQHLLLLDTRGHLAGTLGAALPRCPPITLVTPLADDVVLGHMTVAFKDRPARGLTPATLPQLVECAASGVPLWVPREWGEFGEWWDRRQELRRQEADARDQRAAAKEERRRQRAPPPVQAPEGDEDVAVQAPGHAEPSGHAGTPTYSPPAIPPPAAAAREAPGGSETGSEEYVPLPPQAPDVPPPPKPAGTRARRR